MNDEDLREKFAAWARPLHEAVPPPAGSSGGGPGGTPYGGAPPGLPPWRPSG